MRSPFIRILRYVWPYRWRAVLGMGLAVCVAVLYCANVSAALPFLDALLNQGVPTWLAGVLPDDPWLVMQYLLAFLVVANAVKGALAFTQLTVIGSVVHRGLFDLRRECFHHTLKLRLGHFSEQGTSETTARFTNDVEAIGRGIETILGKGITEPLKMVGSLAVACLISWRLTLVALVLVPAAVGVIAALGWMMKQASRRALQSMAGVYKILQETFLGIKIVKAFTMERYERRRFLEELKRLYRRTMRMVRIEAASPPSIEFLGIVALALAMAGGGYLVLHRETTIAGIQFVEEPLPASKLLAFFAILAAMIDPVRKLSSVYNRIKRASAACERVLAFIERLPEAVEPRGGDMLPPHAKTIEFQGVTFSYDGQRDVLEDVSLTVRHGETIALVGPSGSGKTSLMNLVPRFYEPRAGRILIDGADIATVRLRSLRKQIGLVTQEPILFEDTVAHNIRYGAPHATQDDVEAAARAAYAHDFVMEMPDGYETSVGELGGSLSGGQRQRLTVARAILRDPSILILDEPTSSLDSESEALLQKALAAFMKGRTTFIIAHRLSTIERADRLVVLDEGRVEAVGTHGELLSSCDLYRRLYERQFGRSQA